MKKYALSKLRYRMILLFSIFILIPVICANYYSYLQQTKVLLADFERYKTKMQQTMLQILDDNIRNLEKQSLAIFVNPTDAVIILITPEEEIDSRYLSLLRQTKSYFLSLLRGNDSIRGISLIDYQGVIRQYIGNQVEGLNLQSLEEEDWFLQFQQDKAQSLILQPHYNSFELSSRTDKRKVLSVARNIIDPDTFDSVGILLIDQDIEFIGKIMANQETDEGEVIVIYDGNHQLVYQNQSFGEEELMQLYDNIPKDSLNVNLELFGEDTLVSRSRSDLLGWEIVSFVPTTVIHSKVAYVNKIALTSIIVLAAVILLVSYFISYYTTRSLEQLATSIRELEQGNLETQVTIKGRDEIAQIGEIFNQMVLSLQYMINQGYRIEILNRDAEIAFLQMQINPHFLFNTLSSMKAVAQQEGAVMTSEMILNLSDIFRYGMVKGVPLVTLAEELEHGEKYLALQEVRHGDRFTVFYDIPPNTLDYKVPRLTLQPILENTIHHGFSNRDSGGEIRIATQLLDEKLYLYVSDNGAGMDPAASQELNQRLEKGYLLDEKKLKEDSIGLMNVNQRIKLFYGPKYGVSVHSVPNVETTVKILLKAKK